MPDSPLVSIVTPSFNQADFLDLTLRSVLGQDYPRIEYLVADGSSTDGSVEIIQRYAERLVWWVSEPDRGQADAVNKCLARVQGEIIGWVNSDDLLLPGVVSAVVQAFAAHPEASMVFGDVVSIDERGQTINQMHYGAWGLDELMTFHIIGQPGVFFRRSALQQAGGLDLDYHFLLDHQLWLRLAQTGEMHYLPQPLAVARYHAAAKNISHAARFGEEAYRIVAWMQTQPPLAERFARLNKRIWAGAHRFNARYLLDGGQPGAALKSYGRSLALHPQTALQEWHRMVYAVLCLIGLERLKPVYYRLRAAVRRMTNPEVYH